MEKWREEVYNYYSTNKARNLETKIPDCSFFEYKIKPLLPKDKESAVLDLAAGHGALLYCLKNAGYKNVTGVDISEEEVKKSNELGIDELIKDDLFNFINNTDQTFDLVFLMDILEHLNRSELFELLKTVSKKLKPKASLIIQVPNAEGIFGMRIRYGDITHEQAFTYNSMLQILTTVGFKDILAYEVSPIKKGIKGLIRNAFWSLFVFPFRLILTLETGNRKHYLSQNIIVKAKT